MTEGATSTAEESSDVLRLHELFLSGKFVHPWLAADNFQRPCQEKGGSHVVANFTDLARALACCCGVSLPVPHPSRNSDGSVEDIVPVAPPGCLISVEQTSQRLVKDIGAGGNNVRRHIILILCDGLGNDVIERHLEHGDSILLERNDPDRLRAVFPSTTPAALTTLATAAWPGQHGMPGWDLYDKKGCDYPGVPSKDSVQIRVLDKKITDVRSGRPASEMGFDSWEDIFTVAPWAMAATGRATSHRSKGGEDNSEVNAVDHCHQRRMIYINAYNGDEFPSWYQGQTDIKPKGDHGSFKESKQASGTDFSSWQMGAADAGYSTSTKWSEAAHIGETSYQTLGQPEGSADAIRFFRDGVNTLLERIVSADAEGVPTFSYLYTSHPDKHMHALGVDHPEVKKVVQGIDKEINRLWNELGQLKIAEDKSNVVHPENVQQRRRLDASVIVTADHGHITVEPEEMVLLPEEIVDCLEYANLGVHGKGRHAYLHCRSGLHQTLRRRWKNASAGLSDRFLLLTVEEAASSGLFGPIVPDLRVRPRLGDFVAIAIGPHTLVSPNEAKTYQHSSIPLCQGAHGSLTAAEMKIPFCLLVPTPENDISTS